MPLSLEDAVKQTSAAPQQRGISLDEVYKKQAPAAQPPKSPLASAAGSVVSGAKEAAGKYYSDYVKLANSYAQSLKEDSRANPEGLGPQLLQSGKTLMDLVGSAFSPMESAARTGIVEPIQNLVNRMSGLVQDHVAAEDTYNAQDRRLGQRGQQYPRSGVDWKIHKQDVAQTAEGLNQFIETGVLTGVGLIGGKESPAGEMRKLPTAEEAEALAKKGGKIEAEGGGKASKPEPELKEIKAPEFKTVGQDSLTGKPRVRAVSPEQASAEVSNAMHVVHTEVAPDAPRQSVPGQREGLYGEWDTLHGKMAPVYDKIYSEQESPEYGGSHGAHEILDQMISAAQPSYSQALLRTLRNHVEDVDVHFVDNILHYKTDKPTGSLGEYRWSDDGKVQNIYIKHSPNEPQMTRTIVHEMVHAATSRFIHSQTDSPLVEELNGLYREAKNRAVNASIRGRKDLGSHYGLNDLHEFVAEAMSNPQFQKFLATSKKYSTGTWGELKSMFDHFANVVARMLGVKDTSEAQLLHNTMYVSKRLMEAQDSARFSGDLMTVAHSPEGTPITRGQFNARASINRIPGVRESTGRLAGYVDELLRAVNPEGLGERAKVAGAVIAARIAERVQRTAQWNHGAKERLDFWQSNGGKAREFIDWFERGAKFKDPEMQKLSQWYREWGRQIAKQDAEITGLRYEPRDNYLSHIFEDEKGVEEYFQQKYGRKWGDPSFTKDRSFDLYSEAIKAGFKPKFESPEEIMLARQLSSDIANMQQGILKDLETYGIAVEKEKGSKDVPHNTSLRRAPNGKWYHVDNTAYAVLHNAFDTQSLWATKGIVGDTFRGAMALKNSIVPIRLALSAFHPLHVIHIDNAAATAMAWKNVLAGTGSVTKAVAETLKSGMLYKSFWQNPRMGSRLIKAWRGDVPKDSLNEADAQALQFMTEGGFVPEMSSVYRTNAMQNFGRAIREHSATALWHAPWALLSAMGKPVFQIWIPNLKAASYMREVSNALKNNPGLHDDNMSRQLTFRKIAKSVDNRYGEMSYDTLFWKRWLKDLAVANTLSLGWQMGFIREYGGGALDLGQFVKRGDKSRVQRVREGMLDRPAFVSAYTVTALGYGGLLTWALSGKSPESLMDYVMPLSGEQNPDGSPQRLNTMFYTREFASVYKHMENQGVVEGLGHLVQGKASGLIGLVGEWASGVNSFGQEIRDPDAPAFRKLEQTLAYTMLDLEPISTKAIQESTSESPLKTGALALAGFNPAPKYMNETKTQAHIKQAYGLYVAPKQTPYDRVQSKGESNALRSSYKSTDPGFGDKLDSFAEKHQLSNQDRHKLVRSFKKNESADVYMFSRLPWEEQSKLLDAMSTEERETYLSHSNKKHLRKHYISPEDRE